MCHFGAGHFFSEVTGAWWWCTGKGLCGLDPCEAFITGKNQRGQMNQYRVPVPFFPIFYCVIFVIVSASTIAIVLAIKIKSATANFSWTNQTTNPERASAQKLGWLSMGSGARQCPGQRLAMVMMKSVLVRMLCRFELSLSDESELKFVDGNYMAGETWCVYYSFNKLEKLNIKLEALTESP